jgi:two-component system, LytTR family, sensor kinase
MADRLPDDYDEDALDEEFELVDSRGHRLSGLDFSTNDSAASASDPRRKGNSLNSALTEAMDFRPRSGVRRRLPDLDIALKSILGVWLLYMLLITVRGVIVQLPDFWGLFQRRTVAALIGATLTFMLYLALRPLAHSSLAKKATVAGLLCLPVSAAYATANFAVFYLWSPLEAARTPPDGMEKMSSLEMAISMIGDGTMAWYFLFAAWSSLYVAMSYATQLRAADNRAAALAREAQEAQLRALRYQINPHFLFNTLNSLSSLILSQRTEVAERMIMNLSTFFRTTLSADPTADISLEEEIKLQRLYLDIEQVRFPKRLKVEIDVPEELNSVRVPILILQPIVENAIKYGVAHSRAAVTVRITAHEEAGRLHLKVKDDGETAKAGAGGEGTGVGLRNVCDRLVARYGVQAGCFHGPDPEGGFTVHVILPLIRNG